ncbi:MAG: monooxygenase [Acidobacteriota bacterium]|nr:monooxygenase [Acidobacteriota bacterium]
MALKLLQMDYPFSSPWGSELADEYSDLACRIANVPGLICKVWTENRETGEAGGIYLFEDEASLNSYLEGKVERMKASGIEDIRAKKYDVNERLTRITRGRLSE